MEKKERKRTVTDRETRDGPSQVDGGTDLTGGGGEDVEGVRSDGDRRDHDTDNVPAKKRVN